MYSTVLGTLIAVKPLENPDYGVSIFPTGGLPELVFGLSLDNVFSNFSVFFLREIFSTLPSKLDPITFYSCSVGAISLNSVTSEYKSVFFDAVFIFLNFMPLFILGVANS